MLTPSVAKEVEVDSAEVGYVVKFMYKSTEKCKTMRDGRCCLSNSMCDITWASLLLMCHMSVISEFVYLVVL